MTAVRQSRPFSCPLTKDALEAQGLTPLYGGAFWSKRFQIRHRVTNLGVNLTGAGLVFTRRFGSIYLSRKTLVLSTGAPTYQIILDDQSTEDQDEGTGTGWVQVFDYPVTPEVTEFATVFAAYPTDDIIRGSYDLSVKLVEDKHHEVIFAGPIDCIKPLTTFPIA